MNSNLDRRTRTRTIAGSSMVAGAIAVLAWSSGALASTMSPLAHGPESIVAAASSETPATELARLGGKASESGAFKPDPIYGGGRGRDPYGTSLDTDPYKGNSNPNKIRFAPPNAGLHGKPEGRAKKEPRDDDEYAGPDRKRMNPEDRDEDSRANKAAQRAAEGEE